MTDESSTKTTREVADEYLREEFDVGVADVAALIEAKAAPSEEANAAMFERDSAVRALKTQKANLHVIKQALNDNRPLEALYTANNAFEELGETIEVLESGADE